MKLLDNFSPSFEMNIHSIIPNESIELRGRNNWTNLMIIHSFLAILTIILSYFALSNIWFDKYILFRLITMISIYTIVKFIYSTFKNARHSNYLKEKIIFNEEGIFLNAKLEGKNSQNIKKEGLNHFNLIYDGERFKFLLYSLDKPYFEFAISENEELSPDAFLDNLLNIYDLEIQDGAEFDVRTILTLKKKQCQKEKTKKRVLLPETQQLFNNKPLVELSKPVNKYKPKGFYYYQRKTDLVIEQNLWKEVIAIPSKIGVSRMQKVIWYRNIFFLKKTIKFSEIKKYDFEIRRRSEKSRKYIEGVFIVIKLDGKKEKIFTVERELKGQQELIELDVLKDLRFLTELIKEEILVKTI